MSIFNKLAQSISNFVGKPICFCIALASIFIWAISGPIFHFSDTWQLIINTSTTIITFLMVFLIQNSQNRDMIALHLKIDELIRSNELSDNQLLNVEDLEDKLLARMHGEYKALAIIQRDSNKDVKE